MELKGVSTQELVVELKRRLAELETLKALFGDGSAGIVHGKASAGTFRTQTRPKLVMSAKAKAIISQKKKKWWADKRAADAKGKAKK